MGSQTIDLASAVFSMLGLTTVCFVATVALIGLYRREHKRSEQLEATNNRLHCELQRCVRKAYIVPVPSAHTILVQYAIQDVSDDLYFSGDSTRAYVRYMASAMHFNSLREALNFAKDDLAYTYVSLEKVPR